MKQSEAVMAVRKIFGEQPQIEWGETWRTQDDTLLIKCVVTHELGKAARSVVAFDLDGTYFTPVTARERLVRSMQAVKDDIVDSLSMHPKGET
jgi:hypothetical protein